MKLFLARHGETDWNVQKLACGCSESQLTEKGRSQAQALAKRLAREQPQNNIAAIYVSALKRARDTAFYIEKALGLTAVVDERIKEVNFGDFEGLQWDNAKEFFRVKENPFIKFPAGESLAFAAHRSYSLIEEVARLKTAGNVLFVCHGMITAVMSTYFKDFSQEEFLNLHVNNCQLIEFEL